MMNSQHEQPLWTIESDPFAPWPDREYRPSESDRRILNSLPVEVEDYLRRWVREPLSPALLRYQADTFAEWAAELRSLAGDVGVDNG